MNRSYYEVGEDSMRPQAPLPRVPSPSFQQTGGHRGYSTTGTGISYPSMSGAMPPYAQSQPRLQYEPTSSPTSPRDQQQMALQVPHNRHRPRSLPPVYVEERRTRRRRSRSRSRSSSRSSSSSRRLSPISKARHAVKDTFTDTPSGLGVGILGAIVGGLVAHEASHATTRARNAKAYDDDEYRRPDSVKDHQNSRRLATLAGAVAGGLGANAIEKKFEEARDRDREKQEAWEKKWGKESDLPHYDSGRPSERDHGFPGRGRSGREEVDYEYVRRDTRPRRRSSDDGYRRYY